LGFTPYRGFWHVISHPLFLKLAQPAQRLRVSGLVPSEKQFTLRRASSCTRRRSFSLSAIEEDSRLQPPVGVWAVSQSQWGGSDFHPRYWSSPWWAVTSPTS